MAGPYQGPPPGLNGFAMAGPSSHPANAGAGLPPGWTQHFAPTGQPYYFHAATGRSTHAHPGSFSGSQMINGSAPLSNGQQSQPTKPKKEKPKKKEAIPGVLGWLRITTNLGNIFYTHPESKRSEWAVPDEIAEAVRNMENAEKEAAPAVNTESAESLSEQAMVQPTKGLSELVEATDEGRVDVKRKRTDHDAIASTEEGDISAADLLASGEPAEEDEGSEGEDEEQPMKRARIGSEESGGEHESIDDEAEWQRRVAAEMAVEADIGSDSHEDQQGAEQVSQSSKPVPPLSAPAPPLPPSVNSFPTPPLRGYTGPPPNVPARQQPQPELSLEEGKALFIHMLASLNGTPQEVNPMAPWDLELPKFVHLPGYTALKQLKDRQDAFNDWAKLRIREKREKGKATSGQESVSRATSSALDGSAPAVPVPDPSQAFNSLLKEHVTSTRARFEDFRKEFKKDRRFYGFGRDDREREKRFKSHLRELGETKRQAAERAEAAFAKLLDDTFGHHQERTRWRGKSEGELKDEIWRDVKKMNGLESRTEYDAVGSSSKRAELFVQWAQSLSGPSQDGINGHSSGSKAEEGEVAEPLSVAEPSAPSKEDEVRLRREKALREREEAVRRERSALEFKNRRALHEANRSDSGILFRQLLIDTIRDATIALESDWVRVSSSLLSQDPRFDAPGLPPGEKQRLYDEHVEKLTTKKRSQLQAIFSRFAPRLDAEEEIILPLVSDDAEYDRLRMGPFVCAARRETDETTALSQEWRRWQREREEEARKAFDEMLKENSFIDFWGRLRSEAEAASEKAETATEEEEYKASLARSWIERNDTAQGGLDDYTSSSSSSKRRDGESGGGGAGAGAGAGGESEGRSLVEMAGDIDLEEIHGLLRSDQRYRAFAHVPQKREQWISDYLKGLGGRKKTVWQQH